MRKGGFEVDERQARGGSDATEQEPLGFGGVVVFGVVGLFIGPVVLGGTKVVLDQFARERAESTTD